jgi:5'-nucleotidase
VLKDTPSIVSPTGVAELTFRTRPPPSTATCPSSRLRGGRDHRAHPPGGTATEPYDKAGCSTLSGPVVDITRGLSPEIVAVVSGHTHSGYNCVVDGRVVIQGDFYGHLLQRLDLSVDTAATGCSRCGAERRRGLRKQNKDAAMTAIVTKADASPRRSRAAR